MESISKSDLELKLLNTCEKELLPLGFRIVDLDCRLGGRSLLRIFIERLGSETQVSLEDCVRASRHLDPFLENENVLEGAYELEISSPGLDRRLRLVSDFEKVLGAELKIGLTESIPGLGANVRGKLLKVVPGQLAMSVSGKEVSIPLNQIKKANTVWEFKV
ncbi:MAG: hypothetical protein EBQ85_02310 [Proteobacteria bacterium]|nr:hypothetical protein [Pseudomonadota bacterium]